MRRTVDTNWKGFVKAMADGKLAMGKWLVDRLLDNIDKVLGCLGDVSEDLKELLKALKAWIDLWNRTTIEKALEGPRYVPFLFDPFIVILIY